MAIRQTILRNGSRKVQVSAGLPSLITLVVSHMCLLFMFAAMLLQFQGTRWKKGSTVVEALSLSLWTLCVAFMTRLQIPTLPFTFST